MRLKKLISSSLAIGLLFNSVSPSLASVISEDGRYETFEGSNITIDDILEEDKVDIEIEGNTMVNIFNYDNMVSLPENQNHLGFSLNEKEVTLNYMDSLNIDYNISWDSKDIVIKNGETYTFVADITKNTLSNRAEVYPFLWDFGEWRKGSVYIEPGYIGKSIVSFKACKDNKIKLLYRGYNSTLTGEISMSNIMLLKGDYYDEFTNNPSSIPEYFEGMKSVGELEDNKLNVEVLGENIFDVDYFTNMIETHYDIGNYRYEVKDGRNTIWVANNHDRLHGKNLLNNSYKFKENTQYIIKSSVFLDSNNVVTENTLRGDIYYTDGTKNAIFHSTNPENWSSKTIITNKDKTVKNITFSYGNTLSEGWLDLDSLYIAEYNPDKTEFNHDYNIQNLEIDLKEPLRALPNGVKDRIIKRNGQWVIERNCAEIVLNGSDDEQWSNRSNSYPSETTQLFCLDIEGANAVKSNIKAVQCDRFIPRGGISESQRDWECIFLATNGDGVGIYLRIDNSKLDILTSDGLNKWLADNPTTLVYQLAEPTYEPLNIDFSIQLFEDTTYISNNSIIPANMKLTVDRAINKAIEAIDLAKSNPTVENISKARMWTNLLKESINKDKLHSEINNITDIEDLQLERKTATSNIDVYIKSENMLLMSLSTNSITFNDFSGVNDMELGNAVNISINSSLPYQLNSYLLSEIENNDKSNRIEKDLLNIKVNDDSDYKTFADINEKLVLEDDCDAGNNKSHSIDLRLKGSQAHKADIYKTVIKFEAEQK